MDVVGSHGIEQTVTAVTVKDDLAVACGTDHNRFLRGAALRQDICTVKGQSQWIGVAHPV